MKRYILASILVLTLALLTSCGKTIFYSGEMILDGTTVRYLVDVADQSMKVTAEGTTPDSPITVRLLMISTADQSGIWYYRDFIDTVPYEHKWSLDNNCEYSLWLIKNGEEISFGQFNL